MAETKRSTGYNIHTVNNKGQMNKGEDSQSKRRLSRTFQEENPYSVFVRRSAAKERKGRHMKRAKWLSVLLTGFFLLQLVACNGGTTGTEQAAPESDPSGLYTVDVYALGRASEPLRKEIEARANAIIRDSCGAQISIHYQGLEESCLQQVKLAVSTGKRLTCSQRLKWAFP